jgi:hypothetical protein
MRGIIFIISILVFCQCSNSIEPVANTSTVSSTTTSSTSDHTVGEKGIMHKSGLKNAATNCISCHGNDLKGGTSGISCYSCHTKVWL